MSCQHGGCSAVAALPHQPTAAPRVSAKSPGNILICQAVRKTPPFLSTNSATSRGEFLPSPGPLRRSFCPAHCVLRAHTGNEDAGKGAKRGKGRESQEARELLAQNDGSLVASHGATLATRPALPFTWAGLSSAGSRQLPGALVPQFENSVSRLVNFIQTPF